jgi:hypothetical protein
MVWETARVARTTSQSRTSQRCTQRRASPSASAPPLPASIRTASASLSRPWPAVDASVRVWTSVSGSAPFPLDAYFHATASPGTHLYASGRVFSSLVPILWKRIFTPLNIWDTGTCVRQILGHRAMRRPFSGAPPQHKMLGKSKQRKKQAKGQGRKIQEAEERRKKPGVKKGRKTPGGGKRRDLGKADAAEAGGKFLGGRLPQGVPERERHAGRGYAAGGRHEDLPQPGYAHGHVGLPSPCLTHPSAVNTPSYLRE